MSIGLHLRVSKMAEDGTIEGVYESIAVDASAFGKYTKSIETKAHGFRYSDLTLRARFLSEDFFADYDDTRTYFIEIQRGEMLDDVDATCVFYGILDRKGINYAVGNRQTTIRCYSIERLLAQSPKIVPRGIYKSALAWFWWNDKELELLQTHIPAADPSADPIWIQFNTDIGVFVPADDRAEYMRQGVTVVFNMNHPTNGEAEVRTVKVLSSYSVASIPSFFQVFTSQEETYFEDYCLFRVAWGQTTLGDKAAFFPRRDYAEGWCEFFRSDPDNWKVYIPDFVLSRHAKQFDATRKKDDDNEWYPMQGGILYVFSSNGDDTWERYGFLIKEARYIKFPRAPGETPQDVVELTLFDDTEFVYDHGKTLWDFNVFAEDTRAAVALSLPNWLESILGTECSIYGTEIYGTQGDSYLDYDVQQTLEGLFGLVPFLKHIPVNFVVHGDVPLLDRRFTLSAKPDEALSEIQKATGILLDFVPGDWNSGTEKRSLVVHIYTREYLAEQDAVEISVPADWSNQIQAPLPVVLFEGASCLNRYGSGKSYGWYSEDSDGVDNTTEFTNEIPEGDEIIRVKSEITPPSDLGFFDGDIRDYFYNDPGLKAAAQSIYALYGRYYLDGSCTLRGNEAVETDYVGKVIYDPSQEKRALVLSQETDWQNKIVQLRLMLDTFPVGE